MSVRIRGKLTGAASGIAQPAAHLNLTAMLAVIVPVLMAVRLKYVYERMFVPFEINYEEGNILNAAARVLQHSSLYPDPRAFPYVLNPYGPVGYWLSALGIRILGLSFRGPRLLVLLAAIGVFFLIAALVKRSGGQWRVGFLLGGLYLCTPVVWYWLPLLRVDFWAIFFSLLGLYFFTRFRRFGWLAGIAFALALLTKPTAMAAPLACVAELVVGRQFRKAFELVGAGAAATGLCGWFMGGHFLFHLLGTHPDPYEFRQLLTLYASMVEGAFVVVAIVACALASGYRWSDKSRYAWFYFIACCATALTAGKLGSDSNHFLEWTAAIYIVGGITLSDLTKRLPAYGRIFEVGCVATIAAFLVLLPTVLPPVLGEVGCAGEYAYIAAFPGTRILSEDIGALVLTGKPVLVSNPFVATQLGDSLAWSKGSMAQLAEDGYFDLIFLGGAAHQYKPQSGRWPPALIEAVEQRYSAAAFFQCGVAYVPGPSALRR